MKSLSLFCTCRGLSSHWNFCMSFAPWLPPDLGLRKTSIGTTSGLGIGLTQNGVFFSVLLLFSPPSGDKVEEVLDGWSVEAMVSWHSCIVVGAFDFLPLYLLGEHFKLDLKLPFLGSFTIHEGGTMTWKDYIRMMIESFRQISKFLSLSKDLWLTLYITHTFAWLPKSQDMSFFNAFKHSPLWW